MNKYTPLAHPRKPLGQPLPSVRERHAHFRQLRGAYYLKRGKDGLYEPTAANLVLALREANLIGWIVKRCPQTGANLIAAVIDPVRGIRSQFKVLAAEDLIRLQAALERFGFPEVELRRLQRALSLYLHDATEKTWAHFTQVYVDQWDWQI